MEEAFSLADLGLTEDGEDVTLLACDVDNMITARHSGGIEQQFFEDPDYKSNVRAWQHTTRFYKEIQSAGNVIVGFVTMGTNQERVEKLAEAYNINQKPLFIELGIEVIGKQGERLIKNERSGKNRQIVNMIERYNMILAPYGKSITRVILLDDTYLNIKKLNNGDKKYIQWTSAEENTLGITLEAVQINAPKLDFEKKELLADGKERVYYRKQDNVELNCQVYYGYSWSVSNFIEKLAFVLTMLGLRKGLSDSSEGLFNLIGHHSDISSELSTSYDSIEDSSDGSLKEEHGNILARRALSESCGSGAEMEDSDIEENSKEIGRSFIVSSH